MPSPPTRRKPTRFAAELIHFPVAAFSTFGEVGVDVLVRPLEPGVMFALVLDAMVGVMKLFGLAFFSECEGVFLGVCNGEPA